VAAGTLAQFGMVLNDITGSRHAPNRRARGRYREQPAHHGVVTGQLSSPSVSTASARWPRAFGGVGIKDWAPIGN